MSSLIELRLSKNEQGLWLGRLNGNLIPIVFLLKFQYLLLEFYFSYIFKDRLMREWTRYQPKLWKGREKLQSAHFMSFVDEFDFQYDFFKKIRQQIIYRRIETFKTHKTMNGNSKQIISVHDSHNNLSFQQILNENSMELRPFVKKDMIVQQKMPEFRGNEAMRECAEAGDNLFADRRHEKYLTVLPKSQNIQYEEEGKTSLGSQNENIKSPRNPHPKIKRLIEQNNKIQSNPIFSKGKAIRASRLPVMPNPQCLGCVQFFYHEIGYDFNSSGQKYFILPTSKCQTRMFKNCVVALLQNSKQGYIFISEFNENKGTAYLDGFDCNFDFNRIVENLTDQLEKIVYQLGQKYVRTSNFQITSIPILQRGFIGDLEKETIERHYFGRFVIRIKYNPRVREFSRNMGKRMNTEGEGKEGRDEGKEQRVYTRHWPVECERELALDFMPKIIKNDIEIFSEIESQMQQTFSYRRTTLLKLDPQKQSQLIPKLQQTLKTQTLKFTLFKPFPQYRKPTPLQKTQWILSHECSYQTISKHIGQNKLDDISVFKPQRYVMVVDQNFFPSGKFLQFKASFRSLTCSTFTVFNVRSGMRLHMGLHGPVFFVFQDLRLAILAFCLLVDCGTRRVDFVRREAILEHPNSDAEPPGKGRDSISEDRDRLEKKKKYWSQH